MNKIQYSLKHLKIRTLNLFRISIFEFRVLNKGFTLIEIILVIAVLGVLFLLSAPLYQGVQVRNDLAVAVDIFTQNASRAQTLASYMQDDSSWGVKINSGNIVLFRCTVAAASCTYSGSRDSNYDETFDTSTALSTGATNTEMIFAKFTGQLSSDSCTTISAAQINQSKTIRINTRGNITINETAC